MGYRSELVIKFRESAMEVLSAARKMDPRLDSILGYSEVNFEENSALHFACIKWYEGYPDVDAIMSILHQLDDTDYGFLRLGESPEDIEEMGSPWEFDIYVSRSIEW